MNIEEAARELTVMLLEKNIKISDIDFEKLHNSLEEKDIIS